ncbi:hypothetical protein [Ferribacterium limneticum]|uniref:hypothetical protein n=1 Tax=Ferribacterium limneticum TaxID=76259 RepID=UPI001CF8868E|nr:hypothetical protein [Ferribacterium limneticum]UCV26755.1 hypothetical protein KI617_10580 [Ferribacterium limneticum]UCV30672.1 hypothetical protein KI608_10580 [Ferribacterium limneticum]
MIKIGPATVKALDASIVNWADRADGESVRGACPLCLLFNPNFAGTEKLSCEQCPIGIDTGNPYCEDTPYAEWEIAYAEDAQRHAKAELNYLLNLREECVPTLPLYLILVVDLDERGEFKAHVEDEGGAELFSYENGELVEDGFMKSNLDTVGLLAHLITLGLVDVDARFV